MKKYRDFWAGNERIHGMYVRPTAMFSNSPIQYVGYALFCMMMLSAEAGMTSKPYPKYIESIKGVSR